MNHDFHDLYYEFAMTTFIIFLGLFFFFFLCCLYQVSVPFFLEANIQKARRESVHI